MNRTVKAFMNENRRGEPCVVYKVIDDDGQQAFDTAVVGDPSLAALLANAEMIFEAIATLGESAGKARELLQGLEGNDAMAVFSSLGEKGADHVQTVIGDLVRGVDGVLASGEAIGKLALLLERNSTKILEKASEQNGTTGLIAVQGGEIQ